MEALLILVIVAALLALGYAAFNFIGVKKLDEGTDRMKEIAAAIRVGANAFITYEYKIIAVVVVIIAIAFAAIFTVQYGEFSWEPSVYAASPWEAAQFHFAALNQPVTWISR